MSDDREAYNIFRYRGDRLSLALGAVRAIEFESHCEELAGDCKHFTGIQHDRCQDVRRPGVRWEN